MSSYQDQRAALTPPQAAVYAYIHDYFCRNDQIPPTRAIQAHFGWASQTAAMGHLQRLHSKGWLERNEAGKYRFRRPLLEPERPGDPDA